MFLVSKCRRKSDLGLCTFFPTNTCERIRLRKQICDQTRSLNVKSPLHHWGQGAVTRTSDGRLKFDRNKAIRRGRNLFHNQPIETLGNIVETLPTTEESMRLLQRWKQVCRGWKHHISSSTAPDHHWQRNF